MARNRKIVCSTCRRRKSKCDGKTPSCSTCTAHHIQCEYEKAPSVAYVRSLQARIRELESATSFAPSSLETPFSAPETPAFTAQDDDSFSVNDRGAVSFHNPTSAIHEVPVEEANQGQLSTSAYPTENARTEQGQAPVANAATQKALEGLNLRSIVAESGISEDLARILLQLHWCWLHPAFLFVYRPAFTRDMIRMCDETQPSYCSQTLLKVLFAHSCRFIRASEGVWNEAVQGETFQQLTDRLMLEAKISMAIDTLNTPSIPGIQALLQQSARDVACGRSSQAWLFSGMAFRMAIDLGLHVSTDKLQHYAKSLSPEDIEIRKRLFWSLYAWDKHISLYLGRMPNFLIGTGNVSLDFLDDFSKHDAWEPFYGADPKAKELPVYQPTPGHIISCFTALCKLCLVISKIMLELYSPQPSAQECKLPKPRSRMAAFCRIEQELGGWWATLPSHLRVSTHAMPLLSPPPHITSLNLMYHTTCILLHRPHVDGQRSSSPAAQKSWKICRTATTAIHDLLNMYVNTFGFHHITYMNSYCTYTAATTAVYQLEMDVSKSKNPIETQDSSSTAWTELKFLLDIIQHTAIAMPGLDRSIDIIRARVKYILDRQAKQQLKSLFSTERPSPQPPGRTHSAPSDPIAPRSLHTGTTSNPLADLSSPDFNTYSQFSVAAEPWETWLPAFPGQEVFYGSESMLDGQAGLSPDARSALMGSNLDAHMRLELSLPGDVTDAEFGIFTLTG
ncbi:Zn(II)2Cys6 transcription factor [Aspergillus stella-maris]|uniref:Zn(II)2Cys6 transcription factor n=1 Tax=Aspergillus stella-maris TaxID=1810926 RepID=UPI003CCCD003